MQSIRPRALRRAAWLGLFALALNVLVPVHLAFDMAEAAAAHEPRADLHAPSLTWRVLAVLTGHQADGSDPARRAKGHEAPCPVCTSAATLAGFVTAAGPILPAPPGIPASNPPTPAPAFHAAASLAAYRSRAPPRA